MVLMKWFQEMELQSSQTSFYTQGRGKGCKEIRLTGNIRRISLMA